GDVPVDIPGLPLLSEDGRAGPVFEDCLRQGLVYVAGGVLRPTVPYVVLRRTIGISFLVTPGQPIERPCVGKGPPYLLRSSASVYYDRIVVHRPGRVVRIGTVKPPTNTGLRLAPASSSDTELHGS